MSRYPQTRQSNQQTFNIFSVPAPPKPAPMTQKDRQAQQQRYANAISFRNDHCEVSPEKRSQRHATHKANMYGRTHEDVSDRSKLAAIHEKAVLMNAPSNSEDVVNRDVLAKQHAQSAKMIYGQTRQSIPNRNALEEKYSQSIEHSRRTHQEPEDLAQLMERQSKTIDMVFKQTSEHVPDRKVLAMKHATHNQMLARSRAKSLQKPSHVVHDEYEVAYKESDEQPISRDQLAKRFGKSAANIYSTTKPEAYDAGAMQAKYEGSIAQQQRTQEQVQDREELRRRQAQTVQMVYGESQEEVTDRSELYQRHATHVDMMTTLHHEEVQEPTPESRESAMKTFVEEHEEEMVPHEVLSKQHPEHNDRMRSSIFNNMQYDGPNERVAQTRAPRRQPVNHHPAQTIQQAQNAPRPTEQPRVIKSSSRNAYAANMRSNIF